MATHSEEKVGLKEGEEKSIEKPEGVRKELPESKSKFWKKADVNVIDMDAKKSPPCKHYFVYKSGRQIECQNCHIGFFLVGGEEVKDGHLYMRKKLII